MNWDELITIKDWANALDDLLAQAKKAVQDDNDAKKSELQDILLEYISESPPTANPLDQVAHQAIDDLNRSQKNAILKAINDRNAQLKQLRQLIETASAQAMSTARDIQLKSVQELLGKVKTSVEVLKTLETALDQPDLTLVQKIKDTVKAVEELSDLIKG